MKKQSLNGTWRLSEVNSTSSIPAKVPGDVHRALLDAKKIPDPFYRDNENDLHWIGETDWEYTRSFKVSARLSGMDKVLLCCKGIDTLGTVMLNGKTVGTCDNMFRDWEWDVKELLVVGENRISIRLDQTKSYLKNKQKEHPIFPYDTDRPWMHHQGHLRKQPCNYGWDWGITAITCGIWRDIELLGFNRARLRDVRIDQSHAEGRVELSVLAQAEKLGAGKLSVHVTVSRKGKAVASGDVPIKGKGASVALVVEHPDVWWPAGMGDQPLYDVSVTLCDAAGVAIDQQALRIGLRTLGLDRHKDQWGESFQFVANGVAFFAKGANWIPADAIQARVKTSDYRRLVQDAADVNMNMLRVWGGGVYEDDAFYAICDELGICVWQDFMFAGSVVPTFDKAYMASVTCEVEDNVRRLRHHSCIALWSGNNEMEQSYVGPGKMDWEDYKGLFDTLIPKILGRCDPQRDYWPSSPHTPHGDRAVFNDPTCGDSHLWDVWHGRQPFEWYRTSEHRFCSEFGFQSFPEPKTAYTYTEPQDRSITSYIMEHHQRSPVGNALIMHYMLEWFQMPVGFEMTLWASQIQQGESMKYAIEHWRRNQPRSMGALYWQLNDVWPVASWASIDYHGRWKALHYMARNFFAPHLVSGVEDHDKGTVEVHVTSDCMAATAGTVNWVVTDVSGKRLAQGSKEVRMAAHASRKATTLKLKDVLAEVGVRDVIVWLALKVGRRTVSTNLVTFSKPKHLDLLKPQITTQISAGKDPSFKVTLKTKRPALWAWLSLDRADIRCSDNFVHVRPGVATTIMVTPGRQMTMGQFKKQLRVQSLYDTYNQ